MARRVGNSGSARDGVKAYLNEIGRVPLLTAQQEIELGRLVQRMQQLKESGRVLTAAEKREVRRGERAVNKFVEANLRLVVNVAKKYLTVAKTMNMLDLIQEGNMGLMRGVMKFDPERGYKFSTYAYWWIRQSMTRAIRYKDRVVRLPGNVAEMAYGWNTRYEKLKKELDRDPTPAELAKEFDVSFDDIDLFRSRGSIPLSLDSLVLNTDDLALVDTISYDGDDDSDARMEKAVFGDLCGSVRDAVQQLPERERRMLMMKWGLGGEEPVTMTQIAAQEGVSRERVRQMCEKSQRKIMHMLRQHKDVWAAASVVR